MTRRRTVAWPNHHEHVDGRGMRAPFGEVVGDWPRRRPIRPDDEGRDALSDLGFRGRIVHQAAGRMVVAVDEPWRRDDMVLLDPDVLAAQRSAGPVRDAAAGDDHPWRRLRPDRHERQRETEKAERSVRSRLTLSQAGWYE